MEMQRIIINTINFTIFFSWYDNDRFGRFYGDLAQTESDYWIRRDKEQLSGPGSG